MDTAKVQDNTYHTGHIGAAQNWNPEADRFVDAIVQHIYAVYGTDPRWHHLLHRQILKSSKKLVDQQRQTDTAINLSAATDVAYDQQWHNKLDIALGYPPHPLATSTGDDDNDNDDDGLTTLAPTVSFVTSARVEPNPRRAAKRKSVFTDSPRPTTRRMTSRGLAASAANFATAKPLPKPSKPTSVDASTDENNISMPPTSSSLPRASAANSFTQNSSSSFGFPPCMRLRPSPPRRMDTSGDTSLDDTGRTVVFFPSQSTSEKNHLPVADTKPQRDIREHADDQSRTDVQDEPLPSKQNSQSNNAESSATVQPDSHSNTAAQDVRSGSPASRTSRASRFVEHVRPSYSVSQPASQKNVDTVIRAPNIYEPTLAIYFPPGVKTNLPLPASIANRILQLFHEWTSSQDNYKHKKLKNWRLPTDRYRAYCVQCHVRRAQKDGGLCFDEHCHIIEGTKVRGKKAPVACSYCQKHRLPCLKAEPIVTMASKTTVEERLKLWVLPLPEKLRHGCDPSDEGFWVLGQSQSMK